MSLSKVRLLVLASTADQAWLARLDPYEIEDRSSSFAHIYMGQVIIFDMTRRSSIGPGAPTLAVFGHVRDRHGAHRRGHA